MTPVRPLARLVDANLNRAREALRVLEDLARFVLDEAPLAAECKRLRHELRALAEAAGLDARALAGARDAAGDVGAAVTTGADERRTSPADIAAAAGHRASEALRALEEVLKLHAGRTDPAPARAAARLRFAAYEVERRLLAALAPPAPQWRLCVLVSERLCAHHDWLRVAALAIEGGADAIQLREKTLDGGELLRRACALVALARGRAAVIINDRPDVAILAGADGVHLGRDDLPPPEARRLAARAGARLLIGASTHDLGEARDALAGGADYLGVGAMFPTGTTGRPPVSGPAYLRALLADPALARTPHLAIGGITAERVPSLVRDGARGVAVSAAVCADPDPRGACRALLDAFERAACNGPAGDASVPRPVLSSPEADPCP